MRVDRRSFISSAAAVAGTLAMSGCRSLRGDGAFYGSTIRDRLWMWGHHRDCPKSGAMPAWRGPSVDQAEGCRMMGIPNNCVIRWLDLPKRPWGDYFEQFRALKRFSFGITDGGSGTVWEKMRIAFEELQPNFPNFTGCFLDDYFNDKDLHQSKSDLAKIADEVHAHGLRLSVVLYADQDDVRWLNESICDELALCDEVSFWFWSSDYIDTMGDQVRRCRDMIGPDKDLLLGLYMWDFPGGKPVPADRMEMQLRHAGNFLADRTVTGLIFHPSFAAASDFDSVKMSRAWIAANADREWGSVVL